MDSTGPNFEALPPYDDAIPVFPPAQYPVIPPPARLRWLGPAIGAGAVVLAAGAFLLGHATAGARASTPTLASASAASTSASADPGAGLLSALGVADPTAAAAAQTGACLGGKGAGSATLKAVNGSTLTVTARDGKDVTVKTDANTKVTKVSKGALSDVTNGSTVAVRGSAGATSTIDAASIAVIPAGLGKPPTPGHGSAGKAGFAIGTVQDVTGSSFTVKASDGTTVTVTTSGSTTVSKAVTAKVGDLTVGQPIAVAGTPNGDGSITATNIVQSPSGLEFGIPGLRGPGGFGGYGGYGHRGGSKPGTTTTTTP